MRDSRYQMIRVRAQAAIWFQRFAGEYGLKYLDAAEVLMQLAKQASHEQRKQAIVDMEKGRG